MAMRVPIKNVLFLNALVSIKDSTGKIVKPQALLESGFQASVFTEKMAAALMIKVK